MKRKWESRTSLPKFICRPIKFLLLQSLKQLSMHWNSYVTNLISFISGFTFGHSFFVNFASFMEIKCILTEFNAKILKFMADCRSIFDFELIKIIFKKK